MYEALCRHLRSLAKLWGVSTPNDAADAIEALSKRVPPVPHGRLIDADALKDSFDPSDFWNPDAEDNCFAAIHIVNSAPTIIPAEETPAEDTNAPTGPYDLLYEEGGANTT